MDKKKLQGLIAKEFAKAESELARAALILAQATLLVAEPLASVEVEWSPPVVGERVAGPHMTTFSLSDEAARRVRELLGVLDGSIGSDHGKEVSLLELKRIIFNMLDNPTYPAAISSASSPRPTSRRTTCGW